MTADITKLQAELAVHRANSAALDELANHSQSPFGSEGKIEPILHMLYDRAPDKAIYDSPIPVTNFSEKIFVPVGKLNSFMRLSEMNRHIVSGTKTQLPAISQALDQMHMFGARDLGSKLGMQFMPLINQVLGRNLMESIVMRRNADRTLSIDSDTLYSDAELAALNKPGAVNITLVTATNEEYPVQMDNSIRLDEKGKVSPLLAVAMLFDAARMFLARPKTMQDTIEGQVGVKYKTQRILLALLSHFGNTLETNPSTEGLSLVDFNLALPESVHTALQKAEHDVLRINAALQIFYPHQGLRLDATMRFGGFDGNKLFVPATPEDAALMVAASRHFFRYGTERYTDEDVTELANRVSYATNLNHASSMLQSQEWFLSYLRQQSVSGDEKQAHAAKMALNILSGMGKKADRFSERPREVWTPDGLPG